MVSESRSPATATEHLIANIRPQPAIPAVLAMLLMVLLPAMSAQSGISDLHLWLVPAGLLISCGLAVAAGFCSLAPHVIWAFLAFWANTLLVRAGFPAWHTGLLYLMLAVAAVMFIVQLWRIRTRRFVPTIRTVDDEPDAAAKRESWTENDVFPEGGDPLPRLL